MKVHPAQSQHHQHIYEMITHCHHQAWLSIPITFSDQGPPPHHGPQEKPVGEVTLTRGIVQGPNWAGNWEMSTLWTIVSKWAGPTERECRCPTWNGISGSSFTVVPSWTQTCHGRTERVAIASPWHKLKEWNREMTDRYKHRVEGCPPVVFTTSVHWDIFSSSLHPSAPKTPTPPLWVVCY